MSHLGASTEGPKLLLRAFDEDGDNIVAGAETCAGKSSVLLGRSRPHIARGFVLT